MFLSDMGKFCQTKNHVTCIYAFDHHPWIFRWSHCAATLNLRINSWMYVRVDIFFSFNFHIHSIKHDGKHIELKKKRCKQESCWPVGICNFMLLSCEFTFYLHQLLFIFVWIWKKYIWYVSWAFTLTYRGEKTLKHGFWKIDFITIFFRKPFFVAAKMCSSKMDLEQVFLIVAMATVVYVCYYQSRVGCNQSEWNMNF